MKVVALVSGGIDSAVMCKLLAEDSFEVLPLFINYGQHAAENEWVSCLSLEKSGAIPSVKRINLQGYGALISSGLTSKCKDIFKDAFLPCRNLLFLTVAGAYAHQNDCEGIAIGLLNNKPAAFPDQSDDFIINANLVLNSALKAGITILTPLINFDKAETIQLAEKFGIDLHETWSCHDSGENYCGVCVACTELINSGKKEKLRKMVK